MLEVYVRSTCSSCKKAERDVHYSGHAFPVRDFFKEPLSTAEIGSLLERVGISLADAVATRSVPYKDLDLANKPMSNEEILELMAEHPAVLRRPIVVRGNEGLIGYNHKTLAKFLSV